MIRKLRRRWRYRTAQVTRLRAAVYAARCPVCHREDWEFLSYTMIGDTRFSRMACGHCGAVALWLA